MLRQLQAVHGDTISSMLPLLKGYMSRCLFLMCTPLSQRFNPLSPQQSFWEACHKQVWRRLLVSLLKEIIWQGLPGHMALKWVGGQTELVIHSLQELHDQYRQASDISCHRMHTMQINFSISLVWINVICIHPFQYLIILSCTSICLYLRKWIGNILF